jgi:nitrogen fixation protein FixH
MSEGTTEPRPSERGEALPAGSPEAKRKKGGHWPYLIVALLGVSLSANLALLVLAVDDPSFAVEPEYYEKAMAWDAKRSQDRRNEELGWSLALEVTPAPDLPGSRRLEVLLRDREGRFLDEATVRLETFHNARAGNILETTLAGEGEGRYAALLPLRRPGLWEFRFVVERGEDTYTETFVQDVWGGP